MDIACGQVRQSNEMDWPGRGINHRMVTVAMTTTHQRKGRSNPALLISGNRGEAAWQFFEKPLHLSLASSWAGLISPWAGLRSTAGGADLLLERDGERIGLQVSSYNHVPAEVEGLKKCLVGGFKHGLMVCEDWKKLERNQAAAKDALSETELQSVRSLLKDGTADTPTLHFVGTAFSTNDNWPMGEALHADAHAQPELRSVRTGT